MEENRIFYDFLITLQFPEFYAEIINLIVLSLGVLLTSIFLNFLSKKLYLTFLSNFLQKLQIILTII